ncbi:zinc-binding dehydrogenase [Micromonospora coxensis]|uniref:zinc-binding dehydrogenase n=1 Tax=Micromonospora coxensis TaxID=356852 RepID=UPI003436092F
MRVIEVDRFGGPEELRLVEAPAPAPGAGEVAVDVAVADTLWVDTAIRAGQAEQWFPIRPPYRPGAGVAGTVDVVGAGVDPGWTGRRVAVHTAAGGYADRVVVPAEALVPVPDPVTLTDAAALLHDGVTAFGLLDLVPVRAGDRVLVTAAAGGLGALLVQAAHAAGAVVVAAVRGARKREAVRRLGADVVVDYSEPGWTDRVRAEAGELDVVYDGAGGDHGRAAFALLRPGGRFSAHGAPAGGFAVPDPAQAEARQITVTGITDVQFDAATMRRHLSSALAAVAAGRIRPLVGGTFPLDRAADAHRAIEERAVVGKALLTV